MANGTSYLLFHRSASRKDHRRWFFGTIAKANSNDKLKSKGPWSIYLKKGGQRRLFFETITKANQNGKLINWRGFQR